MAKVTISQININTAKFIRFMYLIYMEENYLQSNRACALCTLTIKCFTYDICSVTDYALPYEEVNALTHLATTKYLVRFTTFGKNVYLMKRTFRYDNIREVIKQKFQKIVYYLDNGKKICNREPLVYRLFMSILLKN